MSNEAAVVMNLVFVLAFDHDAGEGFSAGEADEDAALAGEIEFAGGDGFLDGGEVGDGLALADADVEKNLGEGLKGFGDLIEGSFGGEHGVEDTEGGEEAIAGGGEIGEDDVAGLFSAEGGANTEHFLEDIFVADRGTLEMDALFAEGDLEAEIGHDGGDDAIAGEAALGAEAEGGEIEHGIAVDEAAGGGLEDGAVGIAVEGDAEVGIVIENGLAEVIDVKGTDTVVDITAVGGVGDGDDFSAEGGKEVGGKEGCGAVGAIGDDAEAVEAMGKGRGEEVEIAGGELILGREGSGGDGMGNGEGEDLFFEGEFLGIGEFEAGMIEDFEAIVLVGIVRGGDHDAGSIGAVFRIPGEAGGSEEAGEVRLNGGGEQAGGEGFGQPRAGFAGIEGKEHFGVGGLRASPSPERGTEGKSSGGIHGGRTGPAPDAVGPEELARHGYF
jgi:hypothetical protein